MAISEEQARVEGQIMGMQLVMDNKYDAAEAHFAKTQSTDPGASIGLSEWCRRVVPSTRTHCHTHTHARTTPNLGHGSHSRSMARATNSWHVPPPPLRWRAPRGAMSNRLN